MKAEQEGQANVGKTCIQWIQNLPFSEFHVVSKGSFKYNVIALGGRGDLGNLQSQKTKDVFRIIKP